MLEGKKSRRLRNRRSSVSMLTALMAVPLVGFVGLGVDFGSVNQAYATAALAANTAAMNAAKIAGASYFAGFTDLDQTSNYQTDGVNAGKQWFAVQISGHTFTATLDNQVPTVSVTGTDANVQATVTLTANVASIFGAGFGVLSYPITVSSQAAVGAGPYNQITVFWDNSSSMDIGATVDDMVALEQNSPCHMSNAVTSSDGLPIYAKNQPGTFNPDKKWCNLSNSRYNNYTCQGLANPPWPSPSYPVASVCPVVNPNGGTGAVFGDSNAPVPTPGTTTFYPPNIYPVIPKPPPGPFLQSMGKTSATCTNLIGQPNPCSGLTPGAKITDAYPGSPCAFACHFDNTAAAGTGHDLFAMARQSPGLPVSTPNGTITHPVTLRFDLVKGATDHVIQQMHNYNIPTLNNLTLAVYTFNQTLNQVYPGAGSGLEAGPVDNTGYAAALELVGPQHVAGSTDAEQGIQPVVGVTYGNNNDTNLNEMLGQLAGKSTASGDGASATTPRKNLFIVTDGVEDPTSGSGNRAAISYHACDAFKALGFTVYVVYTEYYPVMHTGYTSLGENYQSFIAGSITDPTSIAYNLLNCSSYPQHASDPGVTQSDYYIQAGSDLTVLDKALQQFLIQALNTAAHFTQ